MANETVQAGFAMHGARSAMAAGLDYIEPQVSSLEDAVVTNPAHAFDLAKTIIESACRTILTERKVGYGNGDDLPKLFKMVARSNLPFLPASIGAQTDLQKSLEKTLNGLHTAMLGVCELRNACGFSSHGADGPRPALETVQALLAAETADAIVGFLFRVHRQDIPPPDSQEAAPEPDPPDVKDVIFEDNPAFNQYVDALQDPVKVFDESFDPSRILFALAPEAYKLYLSEYSPSDDVGVAEDRAGGE